MIMITRMINLFLPHGSRRRKYVVNKKAAIQRHRIFAFDTKRYNQYRHEYYRSQVVPSVLEGVTFSIVVPCFNTPIFYLSQLIDSVYAQKYGKWELILVDASNEQKLSDHIKLSSQNDIRIKYLKVDNKGIAANTNEGIKVATGEYLCFLDHDDMLDPGALSENSLIVNKNPDADLIYSDEDKIDDPGENYSNPHYKPGFSIDLLRSVNYITHFVVVRTQLAREIGGIRLGFDGAQDYDFLLRIVDKTRHVYHIPKVLYHWRQAVGSTSSDFSLKQNVTSAGVKALDDHYKRNDIKATAYARKNRPGFYGVTFELSSAKRAIYILLPEEELNKIKNYVVKCFEKHVKKSRMNLDVIVISNLDDIEKTKYEYILFVDGRILPTEKDLSLNSMFGIIENGSRYSSTKLITNNKIFDNGYIKHKHGFIPLFRNIDPNLPMHFGSFEWNRNVDALSGLFICLATKDIANLKDDEPISANSENITVYGQYQYHLFSSIESAHHETKNETLFNPRLSHCSDPTVFYMDDITSYIKVKK
jgi:glycosyltransferase involved in cell wall biosynthesis